jgi:transposase InsO family protein
MHLVIDLTHIKTIDDLRVLVKGSKKLIIKAVGIDEKYHVIETVVDQYDYLCLSRKEKHVVLRFLKIVTGYKKSQLAHLIDTAERGSLTRKAYVRSRVYRQYSRRDIQLLEETDVLHYRLSAPATHEIVRREYEFFHKKEYAQIAHISTSHLSNLRKRDEYKSGYLAHTQAREIAIGNTKKPDPQGRPGYVRIDTVHQDGVYHLNAVDEVTQWEVIVCVPTITDECMEEALTLILDQFPFLVHNLHSDRGSEYLNHLVELYLVKYHISQTKSRSGHCNDQALVESKNGSVIRKNLGFFHINHSLVQQYNKFFYTWFVPYLNYHRPCGYVTRVETDHKGREKKSYGLYTTPYEKLKQIQKSQKVSVLKPGITYKALDTIAYRRSDNEHATIMRKRQHDLFDITNLLKSRP